MISSAPITSNVATNGTGLDNNRITGSTVTSQLDQAQTPDNMHMVLIAAAVVSVIVVLVGAVIVTVVIILLMKKRYSGVMRNPCIYLRVLSLIQNLQKTTRAKTAYI